MTGYILRRLAALVVTVFGVSVVVFVVSRVLPHDVAQIWVGFRDFTATEEALALIREQYHLDEPLHMQYYYYIRDLLQGDLGVSPITSRPILDELKQYVPNTIELGLAAFVLALLIGIPLGVISATRRNSIIDHLTRIGALAGVSMPVFWLGLLMQMLLYYSWAWFKSPGGRLSDATLILSPVQDVTGFLLLDALLTSNWRAFTDGLSHLVMPALCLSLPVIALLSRMTRSSMLEALSQDYIRTAWAKGLSVRSIHYKHALRNALLPVVTVVGLSLGSLLTGSVVTEVVFYWPGIGRYAVDAILAYDFPAVMAVTILAATIFAVGNLVTDLIYVLLDPRIRMG